MAVIGDFISVLHTKVSLIFASAQGSNSPWGECIVVVHVFHIIK